MTVLISKREGILHEKTSVMKDKEADFEQILYLRYANIFLKTSMSRHVLDTWVNGQ